MLLQNREATENVQLGQYQIPKGTKLFINIYSLHHEEKLFPKALVGALQWCICCGHSFCVQELCCKIAGGISSSSLVSFAPSIHAYVHMSCLSLQEKGKLGMNTSL